MNLRMRLSLAVLNVVALSHAAGQGTFRDLDFEAASVVPIRPDHPWGAVEFARAFPAWTGFIGGQVQTQAFQFALLEPNPLIPFISLLGSPYSSSLQGTYMLGFGSGTNGLGEFVPVALSQTRLVPSQAMSLRFLAYPGPPVVSLGGVQLNTTKIGTGTGFDNLYGVDISSYAGQVAELRFQAQLWNHYLDAIEFSTQAIPEPSVLSLIGVGAMLIGWRWRRNGQP